MPRASVAPVPTPPVRPDALSGRRPSKLKPKAKTYDALAEFQKDLDRKREEARGRTGDPRIDLLTKTMASKFSEQDAKIDKIGEGLNKILAALEANNE